MEHYDGITVKQLKEMLAEYDDETKIMTTDPDSLYYVPFDGIHDEMMKLCGKIGQYQPTNEYQTSTNDDAELVVVI